MLTKRESDRQRQTQTDGLTEADQKREDQTEQTDTDRHRQTDGQTVADTQREALPLHK